MTTNDSAAEKSVAVNQLVFGKKTALRVTWGAWSFRIVGPHQVEVCNESYGFKKDDPKYIVGIEVRGGRPLLAECDCPADCYSKDYDCKHKVALATVGGPTVITAAIEYELSELDNDLGLTAVAGKSEADSGVNRENQSTNICPNGDVDCDGPNGVLLPCFSCFCAREEEGMH